MQLSSRLFSCLPLLRFLRRGEKCKSVPLSQSGAPINERAPWPRAELNRNQTAHPTPSAVLIFFSPPPLKVTVYILLQNSKKTMTLRGKESRGRDFCIRASFVSARCRFPSPTRPIKLPSQLNVKQMKMFHLKQNDWHRLVASEMRLQLPMGVGDGGVWGRGGPTLS